MKFLFNHLTGLKVHKKKGGDYEENYFVKFIVIVM